MAPYQRDWFRAITPSLLAVAAGKKPPIGKFWTERTKGASKDSDIACVLLWLLAFSRVKLDMQVGAADRDQAAEAKKAADDILRLNEWLAQRIESQAWSLVCRATGSQCDIIAADVAGSHGARPDILFLNELSHISKKEFAQNLMDNATKRPNGLVFVATNAGFEGTWQYQWRKLAQRSKQWHFHQFAKPAPWLSDEELEESQQRNSKSRFLRLFWGLWVAATGDFLDQADITASITASGPMQRARPGEFYIAGLDLSVKQDHSALVIIAGDRRTQQLRLAFAQKWAPQRATGKVDLMLIEATTLLLHRKFDFLAAGYDPFQAALMAQRLELQGVPMREMTFTGSNLNLMASTMLDVFRSRRLELYQHPQLLADLGRLTIEEKSYGYRLSATHNEDGHADVATALAIALPIAVEEAGKVPVIAGAVDIDGPTTLREQLEQARELENERRELMEGGADYAGTEA
jgi:hypothetical protein